MSIFFLVFLLHYAYFCYILQNQSLVSVHFVCFLFYSDRLIIVFYNCCYFISHTIILFFDLLLIFRFFLFFDSILLFSVVLFCLLQYLYLTNKRTIFPLPDLSFYDRIALVQRLDDLAIAFFL